MYINNAVTIFLNMDVNNVSISNAMIKAPDVGLSRNERQLDLVGAASGYGGGYCCDTGVDLPTLLALLAGKSL